MVQGRVASSFVIYVDESGDDGFKMKPNAAGSSQWFALSAVIIRKNSEPDLLESMHRVKAVLERNPKDPMHFRDMRHVARLVWARDIAKLPIRTSTVLIHKPSVMDDSSFSQKSCQLYRYTSRLLIERCSWFCRDNVKSGVGDGMAEIIFSNRSGMSYADLWAYWSRLKHDASQTTNIAWDHLDLTKLSAINHDQLSGLQIADCVASAHWQAVTLDKYGFNEPRYFEQLQRKLYRYKGRAMSYGVKFMPPLEELRPSQPHLSVFDGLT